MAAGGTSSMGVIVMATQYNSNNPAFTSRQQMELYQGSMSVKPSLSASHYVECRRNLTPYQTLYIRPNTHFLNDPQLGPLQNYDVGQFYIATCNTNTGTLGELWVKYDVTLKKPKLSLLNQPFLSAMDLGIPLPGTTPYLPLSVGGGTNGLFSNSAGDTWLGSSTVKYFEDAPSTGIVTFQPNNLRQVGVDYIPLPATTNGYLRFPDEAPVGTCVFVRYEYHVVASGGNTYSFTAPVIAQAAAWPPANNKCVGCDIVHTCTSSPYVAVAAQTHIFLEYAFRRSNSAAGGTNLPWGWNPGAFTGTIGAGAPTCISKSLSIVYWQPTIPAGITGIPAGTAQW